MLQIQYLQYLDGVMLKIKDWLAIKMLKIQDLLYKMCKIQDFGRMLNEIQGFA